MSGPRATARVRRETLKAELARQLRRTLVDRDVEQEDLARATGAARTVVQRWCDRERPETITLADVVMAADADEAVARELLEWAASKLGLTVSQRASAPGADDWYHAVGQSLDAAAAKQRAIVAALAPSSEAGSEVSAGELDVIESKLAALEQITARTRGLVEAQRARREGRE